MTRKYFVEQGVIFSDGKFQIYRYKSSSMVSYDQYMLFKLAFFIIVGFLSFNLFFYNMFSVSSHKGSALDKRVMRRTDKEIKEILEKEKQKNK
jgi:dolichyl-phosphate-mannose--protein O-mannosyl transferase